jgi:hypothetical protein
MSDERVAMEKQVSDLIDWVTSAPKGTEWSKVIAMAARVGIKCTDLCAFCWHDVYTAWYITHVTHA